MPNDLINKMSLMKQVRVEVSECWPKWVLLGKRRASQQFSLREGRNFGIKEKKNSMPSLRQKPHSIVL